MKKWWTFLFYLVNSRKLHYILNSYNRYLQYRGHSTYVGKKLHPAQNIQELESAIHVLTKINITNCNLLRIVLVIKEGFSEEKYLWGKSCIQWDNERNKAKKHYSNSQNPTFLHESPKTIGELENPLT